MAAQIRRFRKRLGGVLEALLEAEPSPDGGGASLGPLSLAEAAWAWLEGEGRFDHARRALIGRRKKQVRRGRGLKVWIQNGGNWFQKAGNWAKNGGNLSRKWQKFGFKMAEMGVGPQI